MQPAITDGVAWSVGRSVCHDREPCKNGWTDRDAEMPFGVRTRVGPRKYVLDGKMGMHIDHLAPSGEYDWTVRVRRRCGFFVKLLWPLVY